MSRLGVNGIGAKTSVNGHRHGRLVSGRRRSYRPLGEEISIANFLARTR
jgi:hypothetical protein